MFNGVPDHQLHQFIASRSALTLPLPLPLHHVSSPSFDPFPSHQIFQPHHLLHQLHHQSLTQKNEEREEAAAAEEEEEERVLCRSLELQGIRSISESTDPWSNDEVLALLRIRSNMENWIPDFTWEHVSRKLEELGFKRSAEKCKTKFEEESRYCSNTHNYSKNYRFFGELEALYQGENPQVLAEKIEKSSGEGEKMGLNLEENSGNETLENPTVENKIVVKKSTRKRKRYQQNFELLKGFCEEVVNKMMIQQEKLHCKLLEDVLRRDEERIAREEAWRKQEMARLNKAIELRAHEQAIACDRQTKLIEFLKKFTSTTSSDHDQQNHSLVVTRDKQDLLEPQKNSNLPTSSPPMILPQNSNPTCDDQVVLLAPQNQGSVTTPNVPSSSSQNPNLLTTQNNPPTPTLSSTLSATPNPNSSLSNDREDNGKRWPKHEVDSLISLRCSLYSSVEDKEGASKAPLWERVSKGMAELGYKRSAKRCKEKWENINKYFRKTKDANKKRSPDSKTCPYFHQLSSLYSSTQQGTTITTTTLLVPPENHLASPRNCSESPENHLIGSSSQCDFNHEPILHVDEGERNTIQVPALDNFEF